MGGWEEWGEKEVGYCEYGGEEVLGDHHLGAGVGAVSGENVVLGGVCEAIEKEVDGEKKESPCRACRDCGFGFLR